MTTCVFQKGDIVKGVGPFAIWRHGQVDRVAPRKVTNLVTGATTTYPDEPRVWVRWGGQRGTLSMSPEHLRLVARPGSSAD